MTHSEFKHKKSELYRTALNALIGSYTGSEADLEAVVLLSCEFDWQRHLEQGEEVRKAKTKKPEIIEAQFSETVNEVSENG